MVEECVKLFHAHFPELLRDKETWYHSYQGRRDYEARAFEETFLCQDRTKEAEGGRKDPARHQH